MFTLKKIFPGLPETERGRPFVLTADPKGKTFLYSIANSVIIRNADDPNVSEIVTNHAKKVTSACYAPSGFYIASGDVCGNLKIWDTTNEEHAVKYEYQPISASINDISWSDDSKRLVVAGDGREKFSCALSWDTGTNIGSVHGHTKPILSADFRKVRPFAIVTAGEDQTILHHKGPPFKFDKTIMQHKNFVNCVRYSPDGVYVASAGQDGKIFVFDGKTMDLLFELKGDNEKAHDGGVYSVSWSPCSKKLLSASGDRSCKVWNVPENKCETVFVSGSDFMDQQLGCLWMGDHLISVSLSGKLCFHDLQNPSVPKKCYWGHNKGLVCLEVTKDKKTILTGNFKGQLIKWDVDSGNSVPFTGSTFSNQINEIRNLNDVVVAIGVGKVAKFGSLSQAQLDTESIILDSEPLSVCFVDQESVVIGCISSINLIKNKKLFKSVVVPFETLSVISYKNNEIAVCGSDKKVHFFKLSENDIEMIPEKHISFPDSISKIFLSNDGKRFAICGTSKTVYIYSTETFALEASWAAQANKINAAMFCENDQYIATCGIDGSVNIWKTADRNFRIELRGAHRTYNCVAVQWIGPNSIVSAAQQDCTLKFWDLKI